MCIVDVYTKRPALDGSSDRACKTRSVQSAGSEIGNLNVGDELRSAAEHVFRLHNG